MITLYIQTLLFEALVLIPAMVVYFQIAGFNFEVIVLLFLLPLLALALSCVLGWLVAIITSKMTNKSLFTVLLSVAFLAVYFYFYSKMNSIINGILLNSVVLGDKIKSSAYILYQLGKAACGDIAAFLLIAALCILLFAVVYVVLSVSFIKIVTTKRSGVRRKYVKGEMKVGTVQSALFKKELMRFYSSPAYMLNCGLGTIFMIAGAVYLFIKGGWLLSLVESALPAMSGIIPLLGCAMVCLIVSTNDITAPSISLEGKSLWLTKSLPVNTREIFNSKLSLHLVMTSPFAFICAIAVVAATKPDVLSACLIPLVVVLLSVFSALFGLAINLKLPNFTWVNETVAVKQSASVAIALFGGWGVVALLALGYLPLGDYVTAGVYLLICAVVLLAACAMLYKWIMTRGVKIFNDL